MTENRNAVAAVQLPGGPDLLGSIAAGLGDAGHAVAIYDDLEALAADDAACHKTEVLIVSGATRIEDKFFKRVDSLRGLVSPFIGIEGIDVSAATAHGVVVANGQTPENILSMAEATILLMLTACYDLDGVRGQMTSGENTTVTRQRMLRGRTIGLLGFGRIAQAVAARLAPWDVELLVSAPRVHVSLPAGARRVELDELLSESDIVSVHAPLNDETRGLLDAQRLALTKEDGILVVTSRGGIVDEEALARLVRARPEYHAALDTFAEEPLPSDSPLRSVPRMILTPHAVGHTRESLASLAPAAIKSVRQLIEGKVPEFAINPDAWKI